VSAPWTREAGASAKTNTLPCVPTSCGRYWICALAVAVVGVMLEVTVIGNTGGGSSALIFTCVWV
jgi:hypothetical protein